MFSFLWPPMMGPYAAAYVAYA